MRKKMKSQTLSTRKLFWTLYTNVVASQQLLNNFASQEQGYESEGLEGELR
jgi:hypothetical protein